MVDPALQTAALAGIEFVVNQALALDPATASRLATMEGQVLHIECSNPALTVYCLPGTDGVQLKSMHTGATSSGISGSLSEFVALLQSKDKAAALINGNFKISGDSQALVQLQDALSTLDIDWELPLSRLFGDVAGHQLGRFFRGALRMGNRASNELERNLEKFVHEEAQLLPTRQELEEFYAGVAELSQRVERLQARLKQWQAN